VIDEELRVVVDLIVALLREKGLMSTNEISQGVYARSGECRDRSRALVNVALARLEEEGLVGHSLSKVSKQIHWSLLEGLSPL
jgi:predicted transcriptional regulator